MSRKRTSWARSVATTVRPDGRARLIDQPLQDLFQEEGVAIGFLSHVHEERLQRIGVAQQLCHEALALGLGERPQSHNSYLATGRELRVCLEELRIAVPTTTRRPLDRVVREPTMPTSRSSNGGPRGRLSLAIERRGRKEMRPRASHFVTNPSGSIWSSGLPGTARLALVASAKNVASSSFWLTPSGWSTDVTVRRSFSIAVSAGSSREMPHRTKNLA